MPQCTSAELRWHLYALAYLLLQVAGRHPDAAGGGRVRDAEGRGGRAAQARPAQHRGEQVPVLEHRASHNRRASHLHLGAAREGQRHLTSAHCPCAVFAKLFPHAVVTLNIARYPSKRLLDTFNM